MRICCFWRNDVVGDGSAPKQSSARSQEVFHLFISVLLVRLIYSHLAFSRKRCEHCGYVRCDMIMTWQHNITMNKDG